MMVTERKAKELLCIGDTMKELCIASDCMAWRWANNDGDQLGYCGVAGVPFEIEAGSRVDLLRMQVALQNEHHQKNVHNEINAAIERLKRSPEQTADDSTDLGIVPGARYRKGETVYYISGEMIQEAIIEDIALISVNLDETIVYQVNDKNFYEDQLHSSAAKLKAMMNVFSVDGRIK